METKPDSAPTARRLKLRLLICNPKSYGSKNIVVKGRGGDIPRTREDPYLPGLHSYECKTHTEWRDIGVAISKQVSNQNCLFAYAHFVDLDQPAGAASRVELVPGGVYAEGSADTPVCNGMIPATDEQGVIVGMVGVEAMKGGYGIISQSDPVIQLPTTIIEGQTFETIFPPMDEGSQSGSAGEALEEPESTLSVEEPETRRLEEEETPEVAPDVIVDTPPPAPSKTKPPAKPAPAAKKKK